MFLNLKEEPFLKRDEADNAWLGLGDVSKLKLENPLKYYNNDKPGYDIIKLMRDPANIAFTADVLLNVQLLPMQAVILENLWNRAFPMYIATRGFGKATTLDSPILTDRGWVNMGDISVGDKVYSRNGSLCNVVAVHPQGKKRVCKVKFLDGREIECCEDHLWVVQTRDKKERVLSTKEIIRQGIFLKYQSGGPIYNFKVPNCNPIEYEKKDLPIDPYILGCLLGDGTLTGSTPKIASNDNFIIEEFRKRLNGFKIERDLTNNNYTIVDLHKENVKLTSSLGNTFLAKIGNRLTSKIKSLNLNVGCKEKFIPEMYKYSSIEDRMELIRGLIDTDGHVSNNGSIEFTNVCEKLVDDFIEVLRSLGITCSKSLDDRSDKQMVLPQGTTIYRKPYYRVYINTSKAISKLPRKLERIKKAKTNAESYVSIISATYLDSYKYMQCISVDSKDRTYITKDHLVTHNSYLSAVYALLRCALIPNTKIVIVGAAFRQSKIIFQYMNDIWENAPVLRSICDQNSGPRTSPDRCIMNINSSWAMAVPLGNGDKIRGLRANVVIADEFSSLPPDIFETVVRGFAAVSAKPADNHRIAARRKFLQEKGLWTDAEEKHYASRRTNQVIISGTADYDFKHYADYWRKYSSIIRTRGAKDALEAFFGEKVPKDFSWQDFVIIRVPYELVPEGFMDDKQVAQAKATIHSAIYQMEYGAVFASDSDGFFRRSTIERCVTTNPVDTSSGPVQFEAKTTGNRGYKYVYGVDPASEKDNFSIVILEVREDHNRVVYCWTTNRKDFEKRKKVGLVEEGDFYGFCARKIRDLMKEFPTENIAIDAQGGGIAVMEALHDPAKTKHGEVLLWPIIEEGKEKSSDDEAGAHILHMCQFVDYKWTSEANHGLRKDLEDRTLLFPRFDGVSLALAAEQDERISKVSKKVVSGNYEDYISIYDSLEDVIMEIEELKNELCSITLTRTGNGVGARDRWDTPETVEKNGRKGRQRKDRYSSLVMANMIARQIQRTGAPVQFGNLVIGGLSSTLANSAYNRNEQLYRGPAWYVEGVGNGDWMRGIRKS